MKTEEEVVRRLARAFNVNPDISKNLLKSIELIVQEIRREQHDSTCNQFNQQYFFPIHGGEYSGGEYGEGITFESTQEDK